MNASELYEIVKDVDRKAWPETSAYMTHTLTPFWVHLGKIEDARLMHLAFVGSMVAWLLKNQCQVNIGRATGDAVFVSVPNCAGHFVPSLIEALAAACKEARP